MNMFVLTKIDLEGTGDIFRFSIGVYDDWKIAVRQQEFLKEKYGSKTRVYSLKPMEVNHDFSKD